MLVILIRTFLLYLLVVIAMRMMGKRQVGELQPSELVIAIMISDVASIPMQNTGVPLLSGVVPILTLLIAELMVSFISLKNRKIRRLLSGKPSLLIYKGKINEREMARQRFNLEDLLEELRISNYADVSQIDYAILETNGQISVIPKTEARAVTIGDLNLQVSDTELPYTIISDGQLDKEELKRSGRDEVWLDRQLHANKVGQVKDVFLGTIDSNGNLFIQVKEGRG